MRRDTAGLARSRTLSELGDWGECCAVTSCAGSFKAVAATPFLFYRSTAALDSLFSQRSGVIAALGDDAGMMPEIVRNVHGRSPIKIEADDLQRI
jgi:hypothetical protein